MLVRSNRFMFAAGLILAFGLFAIFGLKQSPAHMGHAEAAAAPLPDPPAAAVTTVTVNIQNFSFTPSTITIAAGTIVRWHMVNGVHSTTSGTCCSPNGLWDSDIMSSGQNFDRTFSTGGSFPYYCQVHGAMMTGVVNVTPASTATVSGRVLAQNGRGIKGARVVLTDQGNVVRNVNANQFGSYQFDNVTTGQNYTLSVQARRCTFTPRSLSVSGNLTSEDIICQ